MRFNRLFLGLLTLLAGVGSAEARVVSELRLLNDSFLSPAFDSDNKSNYQFLGAAFQSEDRGEDGLQIDIRSAYAFGEPLMSYINLSELYYRTRFDQKQEFALGRRRMTWSELDARWNFGLIEPVFKWNPLSPERQGLSGLFWQTDPANVRISLFGSFLYLPDQGPSFDLNENGEFERGNPWFSRPPDSLRVLSEASKIEYRFQKPNESQIVLQPSYGARLEIGTESPWKARASHLYKPANQLALGYDGVLDIARDRGVVEIQPAVILHTVTSLDLAYQTKRVHVGIGAALDHPTEETKFEERWTAPRFSDAYLVSPFIDYRIDRSWTVSAQAIDISGGEVTEEGALASPGRPAITTRYPFQQAAQVSLAFDRSFKGHRRLSMRGSYMTSQRNQFELLRAEARYELSRLWSMQAEMQLVAAEELTKENRNAILPFNNNDRLQVGVGYAF